MRSQGDFQFGATDRDFKYAEYEKYQYEVKYAKYVKWIWDSKKLPVSV